MLLSVKSFAILVLLCPLTSAVDCRSTGSCVEEQDETSLVQVKQILKPGGERRTAEDEELEDQWPTPVHDAEAVVASMPNGIDEGEVASAYENNIEASVARADKSRRSVAEQIAFDKRVRAERLANKAAADTKVADYVAAADAAIAADQKDVEAVAAKRASVKKQAVERVDAAKEDWEAHAVKKRQAEKAAIEGRLEGEEIADRETRRQKAAAIAEAKAEAAEKARAEEMEAKMKRAAARRAAIDAVTEKEQSEQVAWEADVAADARDVEAHADAEAHVAEEKIEGAEGMKNRITTDESEHVANHYERKAAADQQSINKAALR